MCGLALGLGLLSGLALAAGPTDRIAVDRRGEVLELSWSDTEERLQGALQPGVPRAGEPLRVLLNVGSYQGAAFEGPITLRLRERGATHGPVQTLKKGDVNWHAEFVPERAGPHQLDVSFRTTRLKVLHADLDVEPARVPRLVLWALMALAIGTALALGLRNVLRSASPSPPLAVPLPGSAPEKMSDL